jgi:hypothetical protein
MKSEAPLGETNENDGAIEGFASADPVDDSGGIPGSDLSAITHADGLAILDEYFPKSATGLGPLSGLLIPEPPTPPARVALPGSPGVWTAPSAGPDVEVEKEPEIACPEPAIDSVESCGSISHSGSPGPVSSPINPTRCHSYETNATDIDSLDVIINYPFIRRAVLDDGSQLLEDVLVISICFGSGSGSGSLICYKLGLLGQFASLLIRALHSLVGPFVSRRQSIGSAKTLKCQGNGTGRICSSAQLEKVILNCPSLLSILVKIE